MANLLGRDDEKEKTPGAEKASLEKELQIGFEVKGIRKTHKAEAGYQKRRFSQARERMKKSSCLHI